MRTAGTYLLYAAFTLRGVVRYAGLPEHGRVVALLALYGLILVAAEYFFRHAPIATIAPTRWRAWLPAVYLVVQSGLAVGLLAVPPHIDFFAGLFIPLSLQAVLFFGARAGLIWIGAFSVAMLIPLLAGEKGYTFALAMAALNSGLCFLFGGYAIQVQKAEARQRENRRLFAELQVAHRRLQGYAAQMEELAVEHERSRLARELHDSVTQTAFSMNLTTQAAALLLGRDPARAGEQLDRLQTLAASAMHEIQTLASQLRPRPTGEGLPAALERLAAERLARDGLQLSLDVCGDGVLPEPVAAGLYRIAQEALSNVAKHAGTGRAAIRLDTMPGSACLEIEDAGQGFDPQSTPAGRGHLGLAGMAEQAREIGWVLSVDTQPGRGVRLRVAGPVSGGDA